MSGLKLWAKQELQYHDVQDLMKAMLWLGPFSSFDPPSLTLRRREMARMGEMANPSNWMATKQSKSNKDKARSSKEDGKEKKQLKCFLDDGPHMAQECSTKPIVKEDDKKRETWLGYALIFSSIQKKGHKAKGMMYVHVEIAGQCLEVLLDIGVLNVFMARPGSQEAWGQGGEWEEELLKTMNSKESVQHWSCSRLGRFEGQWVSSETVEVIPLNDYNFVIGWIFSIESMP